MVAVVGVEPIKILRINRIKLDLWKPAGGFTPPSLSVVNTAINGGPGPSRTDAVCSSGTSATTTYTTDPTKMVGRVGIEPTLFTHRDQFYRLMPHNQQ